MPRYLVERTFPDGLAIPINDSGAQACLNVVNTNAQDGVTWIHSYVTPDSKRTYCVYDAPTPEAVRRVAERNKLPVDRITEVRVLDPYFYPVRAAMRLTVFGVARAAVLGILTIGLAACASSGASSREASNAPLAQEVRRSTERYQDVAAATAAGYAPFLGCVTSPQGGAMGIHYVNGDLVGDGKLHASRPEALMYEPRGARLELIGVEYIVIASAWDAANRTPPTLMGSFFHYNTTPNRYGIPAFYSLHVWAWKPNPYGVFADWNARVSCEHHTAEISKRLR